MKDDFEVACEANCGQAWLLLSYKEELRYAIIQDPAREIPLIIAELQGFLKEGK